VDEEAAGAGAGIGATAGETRGWGAKKFGSIVVRCCETSGAGGGGWVGRSGTGWFMTGDTPAEGLDPGAGTPFEDPPVDWRALAVLDGFFR
jgi:hypothetical protein